MQTQDIIKQQGSYLPHWRKHDGIYAVTFRLIDAVPQEALKRWQWEREDIEATAKLHKRSLTRDERFRLREFYSVSIEQYLRTGHGSCFMRRPDVAELVADTLRFFEGARYFLYAWCVMPNHMHAVVRPLGEHTLSEILHSWKSFSARKANALLSRSGPFWQREYYDHLIRSRQELLHAMEYAWENPSRGGLRDWPWRWKHEAVFLQLSAEDPAVIRGR